MYYVCQSDKNEPLSDPPKSIKLRGDPQKLKAPFLETLSNIEELKD